MSAPAPIERPVGFGPFLRLPLFEGPLELLIHLCRRQELPLSQLPVAEVTAQFLAYLEVLDELELGVAGEFVETAALLCLLKSRALLPADPTVEAEEEDDDDPRLALIQRLLAYKSFKDAANQLELRPRLNQDFFLRPFVPLEGEAGEPPIDCDLTDLLSALRDLLERSRQRMAVHEVVAPHIPLGERMVEVLAAVRTAGRVELVRLVPVDAGRPFIVVTFLAVLHLAHERRVRLFQDGPGTPILLEAA